MKTAHIDLGLDNIWWEIVNDLRHLYDFVCCLYLFYRKEKKEIYLMGRGRVDFDNFLKGIVPDDEIIEIEEQIRKETTFFERFLKSENELNVKPKKKC